MALRPFVWKTFGSRQSDVGHVFSSEKRQNVLFLHCVYEPNCENFWFWGHIYFAKRFLLPEGLLCGERLKNDVRLSDVCLSDVCPDFSGKSSVAYSERDINFGFIYLGKISRSEKSKNQNAFRYLAIVTTSSFFEEKLKNVLLSKYDLKIRNFHNWVHIHSVKYKVLSFFGWKHMTHVRLTCPKRLPHKRPEGHPCPAGVS